MDDDLERRYDRLVGALVENVALLRRYGEDGWANWLDLDRVRILGGDGYGVEHVLQAFGGMGSLNDVVIHSMNGHQIAEEDIAQVNERLGQLRSVIFENATRLAHAL